MLNPLVILTVFLSLTGTIVAQNLLVDWQIDHFDVKDGLSGNDVRSIAEDTKGNIWFGTRNNGATYLSNGKWTAVGAEDGLSMKGVGTMFKDKNGTLWFAGLGLQSFDGEKWSSYDLNNLAGIKRPVIFSVSEDDKGILWFGGVEGAIKFDGISWMVLTEKDGLKHRVVHDVIVDKAGSTWFATRRGGLNNLHDGKWGSILVGLNCRALLKDTKGNLWVGTGGSGLYKYDGKRRSQHFFSTQTVLPVTEASDGAIWFSTEGNGVHVFDGEWANYTVRDGLASDVVYSVFEDSSKNIWLGTDKGVSRLTRKNVNEKPEPGSR